MLALWLYAWQYWLVGVKLKLELKSLNSCLVDCIHGPHRMDANDFDTLITRLAPTWGLDF